MNRRFYDRPLTPPPTPLPTALQRIVDLQVQDGPYKGRWEPSSEIEAALGRLSDSIAGRYGNVMRLFEAVAFNTRKAKVLSKPPTPLISVITTPLISVTPVTVHADLQRVTVHADCNR